MKTLNITFTDAEFKKMKKAKEIWSERFNTTGSWHAFIKSKCTVGVSARRASNGTGYTAKKTARQAKK